MAGSGLLGSPSLDLVVPTLTRTGDASIERWTTDRHPAFFATSLPSLCRWVEESCRAADGDWARKAQVVASRPVVRFRPGTPRSRFLSIFAAVICPAPVEISVKVRRGEVLDGREIYPIDRTRIGDALEDALREGLGEGPRGREVREALLEVIRATRDVSVGFEADGESLGLKVYVVGFDQQAWDRLRRPFGAGSDPGLPEGAAPKWPLHDPEAIRLGEYRAVPVAEVRSTLLDCFGPGNGDWVEVVAALVSSRGQISARQLERDPGERRRRLVVREEKRRSVDLVVGEDDARHPAGGGALLLGDGSRPQLGRPGPIAGQPGPSHRRAHRWRS